MSGLTIRFKNTRMGAQFKAAQTRTYQRIHAALGATATQAADEIKSRGDADIRSAGKFGPRWTDSFHSTARLRGADYSVLTSSDIFYFGVFEFGKVIHGQPLLWIPLSFAADAQGVRARDYPGGLFRVDRKRGGAPLLLSVATGQPKYFGRESVRIPRKFHIRDICKDVARKLKTIYSRNLRNGR